jgi:hypothetical protein
MQQRNAGEGPGKEQAGVRPLKCGSESERQCKLRELGGLGADREFDERAARVKGERNQHFGVPF